MNTRIEQYEARRALETSRRKKPSGAQNLRRSIREQPCARCGVSHSIECHHIVPRSKLNKHDPALHSPQNLMPLCHTCHQDHHTQGSQRRVPRRLLTPDQLAFVADRTHPGWIDRWYPE